MLILLRVLFYLQALLGVGRFTGMVTNPRIWETHISLGVLIAILALVALRPRTGVPATGLRTGARVAPLLPLATGLLILTGTLVGMPMMLLHMVLGLGTLGMVEAAAARERRALTQHRG